MKSCKDCIYFNDCYESNQHHTKVEISEHELYKKFKDKYNNIKGIKGLEVNDNWL